MTDRSHTCLAKTAQSKRQCPLPVSRQVVPLRRPEDEARLLDGLRAGGLPAPGPQARVA